MNISSPARQQPLSTSSRTELWFTHHFLNLVFIFNFIFERKPFQMFKAFRTNLVMQSTHYGLDGPEIETRLGRDFPHMCRPALRLTQPPVQWVRGLSRVKWRAHGVDHPPPSSAEVKERVELYMYSLSRPSWPVLGWTLPFTFTLLCSSKSSYDESLSLCIIHAYSGAALTSYLHVPFIAISIYWLLLPYSQSCVRLFEVTPRNGVRNLIMCPFF